MIGDMLNYLDGYPISLPARYANRVACYEEVYITANTDPATEAICWDAVAAAVAKAYDYHCRRPYYIRNSPNRQKGE